MKFEEEINKIINYLKEKPERGICESLFDCKTSMCISEFIKTEIIKFGKNNNRYQRVFSEQIWVGFIFIENKKGEYYFKNVESRIEFLESLKDMNNNKKDKI